MSNIASRMLSVATEASPEVVKVMMDRAFAGTFAGYEPATVSMDAKTFKAVPADRAEDLVLLLDADSLCEVFAKDKRKGVRRALVHAANIPERLAPDLVRWCNSNDTPFIDRRVVARLLSLCADDALDDLEGDGGATARQVRSERYRRCVDVAAVEALVAKYDKVSAADVVAALRSASAEVRTRAVALVGRGQMPKVVAEMSTVDPLLVPALLEHDELREAIAQNMGGSRYSRFDCTAVDELRHELHGPRAAEALEVLGFCREYQAVLNVLDADVAALMGEGFLTQALATADGTEVCVPLLVDRAIELLPNVGTLAPLMRALGDVPATVLGPERMGRLIDAVDGHWRPRFVNAAATLVSSGETDPETVALRERLLTMALEPQERFTLVPFLDVATAAEVVWDMVQHGPVEDLDPVRVHEVLNRVPLPEDARVSLVLSCGERIGRVAWLTAGSGVNPVSDRVLHEVASRTRSPEMLPQSLLRHPVVLPVLLERLTDDDSVLAWTVAEHVPLTVEQLAAVLEVCPAVASDLVMGTAQNPVSHELRHLCLATGLVSPVKMLESFMAFTPDETERAYLTKEAFATADANGGYRFLSKVLDRLELTGREQVALLAAVPRLIGSWHSGAYAKMAPSRAVLQELMDADALDSQPVRDIAATLVADEAGRRYLVSSPSLLEALRAHRYGRYDDTVSLLRFAWEYLNQELGDDAMAWSQVTAQLDDWPGSLESLVLVAKASI